MSNLKTIKKKQTLQKTISNFRPMILSRHPSHNPLRKELPLMKFRSVIRFGSTTELDDTVSKNGNRIELNTTEAIKNSSSKLRMKQCFDKLEVKTAIWWNIQNKEFKLKGNSNSTTPISKLEYPIVAKNIFGSRGTGNHFIENQKELEEWLNSKNTDNYIFEKFYNYNREYRLHVTKNGCFYTCRKMIKQDTPEDQRWFRNDKNSTWIVEENELFDRPVNWKDIEIESVKALNAVGLDFGAVDLRIQSAKDSKQVTRKNPEFIVIEINSAPSFGNITLQKYLQELPKLLIMKKG